MTIEGWQRYSTIRRRLSSERPLRDAVGERARLWLPRTPVFSVMILAVLSCRVLYGSLRNKRNDGGSKSLESDVNNK
jgi:hypothetical protein